MTFVWKVNSPVKYLADYTQHVNQILLWGTTGGSINFDHFDTG